MKLITNIDWTVLDDLKETIKKGSKISIAAGCFSIYAYQALKKELEFIDQMRFIFTSPTFVKEKAPKEKREFYIPQIQRESSLYGTAFEVKLRNELNQKALAKECADWIRNKVTFKSNITQDYIPGFLHLDDFLYMPINEFSTIGLGIERGQNMMNPVQRLEERVHTEYYLNTFDHIWQDPKKVQDVTDLVLDSMTAAYKENSPEFIYFYTIYHIFSAFLEDVSEDDLPNEATGFKDTAVWNMLYDFQRDAVLAIINKLEKYNGCILADSVGLGKTFTALAVMAYYLKRNKSVLVLCPKKLSENWNTYKHNYKNNPIGADRLKYDVLFHTDLSRERGQSNGLDLELLNWDNYDLVVIDESHNFRNGGAVSGEEGKENRYLKLMNKVIRSGVRTKVLMLSATPVNNRFIDLKHQLALAYEGDPTQINAKLDTGKSIDDIFRNAQKAYNAWTKRPAQERTTDALLEDMDFDFFELLDSVTIARSRRHIEKYYNASEIGSFPERLPPLSLRPCLTDLEDAINYNQIYEILSTLLLKIYTPSEHILPSKMAKYQDLYDEEINLTQAGREQGIRRLMSVNLLKRLESSVYAFKLTLDRMLKLHKDTIQTIRDYQRTGGRAEVSNLTDDSELDFDDQNTEYFTVGKTVKIHLEDMDHVTWLEELEKDEEKLELLTLMIEDITPDHDTKLQTLLDLVRKKIAHPINPGNKKILIFTAFSDTADYLYENISPYAKKKFGLETAEITGTVEGKSTLKGLRADLNTVLTYFSPKSKGKSFLTDDKAEIDILVATDCISEGQNLQDCDYVVNYDIHWNPVRIIQRFGRVDRIGSTNSCIQLVNFWPDMDLDEYINLKSRVEARMRISVAVGSGDDDPINLEEKGDLEYRAMQIKRLQKEVVDLEEMTNGVSITDLGLNEFRLDLMDYLKTNPDIERAPKGMHAVVGKKEDTPEGIIFILKNINDSVNIDNRNRIHPFSMVYMGLDGEVVADYLNPKKLLDTVRYLCKGQTQADLSLCKAFNEATQDGRDMGAVSALLNETIASIIEVKEVSDIDSLFSAGGTSALLSDLSGLEDFELISFLVIR